MKREITVSVHPMIFALLEGQARVDQCTVEQLAADAIELFMTNGSTPMSRKGRGLLEQSFGSISTGDPHSSDNERIDADLAREYGNDHEAA